MGCTPWGRELLHQAFSRGFRTAFQVPDSQPSLAGLITTNRHRRWIETFLAGIAPA
ncbi:hypothetical protein H8F24_15990 [Synechococcus sp. CBW1002]|uniref:hypothetical protein n=1 Tax=unclassified Synechococcus TaxID=2626047 RepID=UPI0018CEF36F|nr:MULTISPECIES: hypothetical protein [unclassified Synechococcus]QPN61901.1 hypothetical protein H8F24_15990 [Synechococcus sp. CBW1002]QPN68761.1 hypothetical protein H8F26_16030 [Synechococcus sp. CBW1006]